MRSSLHECEMVVIKVKGILFELALQPINGVHDYIVTAIDGSKTKLLVALCTFIYSITNYES